MECNMFDVKCLQRINAENEVELQFSLAAHFTHISICENRAASRKPSMRRRLRTFATKSSLISALALSFKLDCTMSCVLPHVPRIFSCEGGLP